MHHILMAMYPVKDFISLIGGSATSTEFLILIPQHLERPFDSVFLL